MMPITWLCTLSEEKEEEDRHINFIYTLKSGLVEQHFKSNVEAYLP